MPQGLRPLAGYFQKPLRRRITPRGGSGRTPAQPYVRDIRRHGNGWPKVPTHSLAWDIRHSTSVTKGAFLDAMAIISPEAVGYNKVSSVGPPARLTVQYQS